MRPQLGKITQLVIPLSLIVPLTLAGPALAGPPTDPQWQQVDVGTSQGLRGLDAVDARTAWVGGSGGGVWRTTDAGSSWQDVSPPDTTGLMFRDVEAQDADRATVLAIGEGDASRIYRTQDGGQSWDLTFVNDDARAFYNCMDFFPGGLRGLAVSDPVDGKFRVIGTRDGGRSWSVLPTDGMPEAVNGEYNFAASGTCLVTAGARDAWIASGGAASRIFHSSDAGRTWEVSEAPIPATEAGGVFSVAFRNPNQGIAVGGDFLAPDNGVDASGLTRDGQTWAGGGDLGGYRSGADWVAGARSTVIAVGPSGSDISHDQGRTWETFSDTGFDSVVCTTDGACWASGSKGRVARLSDVG